MGKNKKDINKKKAKRPKMVLLLTFLPKKMLVKCPYLNCEETKKPIFCDTFVFWNFIDHFIYGIYDEIAYCYSLIFQIIPFNLYFF